MKRQLSTPSHYVKFLLGSILAFSSWGAQAEMISSPIPSAANGAWAYDSNQALGGQISAVMNYNQNQAAITAPTVNMIFNYGADMEMYCQDGVAHCTSSQMQVYYTRNGQNNTAIYKQALAGIPGLTMSPIIDGRFDGY